MMEGARTGRWDDVVRTGRQYCEAIERLKAFGPLDDDQKEARRELLARILEDDARIRQLIAPELDRLGHLLGASRQRRSVLRTYRSTVRSD